MQKQHGRALDLALILRWPTLQGVKPNFVTWQLRRLHTELDAIDRQRGSAFEPAPTDIAVAERDPGRDRAARRLLLERMLRSLPKRLGFRDARALVEAIKRVNDLAPGQLRPRRRLTMVQVRELERRVLANERPLEIARVVGCAEQTVLNRASQLRKRLAALTEKDGGGI